MENRNQLLKDSFGGCLAGFGIAEGYLAGVDRSGRGFNPRPAQDRGDYCQNCLSLPGLMSNFRYRNSRASSGSSSALGITKGAT